jgi:hypothetical protein
MSLVQGSGITSYSPSPAGNNNTPSSGATDPAYYYRHPLHHSYGSPSEPSQSYYLGSGSWSESPGSSGRSVSPCDEYQPPDYSCGGIPTASLQDLTVHQSSQLHQTVQPYGRVTKRRTTANKKERRRTQSINNAFADLRDCIPNVPSDTKLSKIKTLRLATSYIGYLMGVLADEEAGSFRADLVPKRAPPGMSAVQRHHVTHSQQQQDEHAAAAAEHARRCNELVSLHVLFLLLEIFW